MSQKTSNRRTHGTGHPVCPREDQRPGALVRALVSRWTAGQSPPGTQAPTWDRRGPQPHPGRGQAAATDGSRTTARGWLECLVREHRRPDAPRPRGPRSQADHARQLPVDPSFAPPAQIWRSRRQPSEEGRYRSVHDDADRRREGSSDALRHLQAPLAGLHLRPAPGLVRAESVSLRAAAQGAGMFRDPIPQPTGSRGANRCRRHLRGSLRIDRPSDLPDRSDDRDAPRGAPRAALA